MQLYADPVTVNCRKVIAGFDLMGVVHERVSVNYFEQGHKSPEFMAINPNGALPALVDGDLMLWESNAILQYAADVGDAARFYPRAPAVRADIHRWCLWEAATWFPSCYVFLVQNVVMPLVGSEPDAAALEAETPNFHRLANILDRRLADRPWLCGDGVTIADIAVAAPMHLHSWQKLPLEPHPNLRRWMTEGVEQLPCWKRTDSARALGLKPA
ncbi:MAG: glutathione S-transferase family protein [Pseudomonadota bacterium]|nr:glutathione S-transferase family protein [Pseudomonadota bacterium]